MSNVVKIFKSDHFHFHSLPLYRDILLRTGVELDPDANRCLPPPGEGDERVAGQTQVGQVRWSDTGGRQAVGNTICNDFRQRNKKLCLPFLGR